MKRKNCNHMLGLYSVSAAVCTLSAIAVLTGCNVTRTITTKSEYQQKGDTTVIIQSKTIEQYDASKKAGW